MKTITLHSSTDSNSGYKYELREEVVNDIQKASIGSTVVDIYATALNHRDVWILKGMYPGIKTSSVIGSDAVGLVRDSKDFKENQRVLINPGNGWDKDERGPENKFSILGLLPCIGTMAESVVVASEEIVLCPEHLTNEQAAALPLAGLTAYRALFTKAKVQSGEHVLVTGIGGGVALIALQFALAAGAHVYVSSSSSSKIALAVELGAKGGFNYKKERPLDDLENLLGGNKLSAIIDGAGGPLYKNYPKFMREGGIIVNYGQTGSIRGGDQGITFSMNHVLKNIDVCGSTMGSRQEFRDMVSFVDKHKIEPVVHRVWQGLTKENLDDAMSVLEGGEQSGKLVIQVVNGGSPSSRCSL